jgi:hypothetical protein
MTVVANHKVVLATVTGLPEKRNDGRSTRPRLGRTVTAGQHAVAWGFVNRLINQGRCKGIRASRSWQGLEGRINICRGRSRQLYRGAPIRFRKGAGKRRLRFST